MKLKTSFFSKAIIYDDFRRFGWLGIAYMLALFFAVPLQILMFHSSELLNKDIIKNLFYLRSAEIQSLLIVVVPVLLAIFLFRYMQVKNSSDMIHSLPIKRTTIYRSHILIGLLTLILPVIIIGSICGVIDGLLNLDLYYNFQDIVQWIGITILFDLVFFFTAVFVGMVVGSSVLQGILTYIFLFLPLGLTLILTENFNIFIYGFMYNIDNNAERLSPMVRVFQGFNKINNMNYSMGVKEVVLYIFICIGLCIFAQYVYIKRNMEAVSQTIAFRTLQYVFKYGVAFCTMLIGGLYFQQTQKNMNWISFGFFIGSFIGYFVAEMIVKKSIWVFKNVKGYLVYAVIMIIAIQGINFDVIGYERKVPDLGQVNNVYFSDSFYNLNFKNYNMDVYSDKQSLQNIYDLHKKLIEDKDKNKYKTKKQLRTIVFIYNLKDGSKIQRGYNVSYDDYAKYLKPIYESQEYKKSRYDVLNIEASDIDKITIRPNFNVGKSAVIIKPEDIKEAVDVLKLDIMNETYEQINDQKEPWAEMTLMVSDDSLKKYPSLSDERLNGKDRQGRVAWKKSYKLFEEWLNKKGYLENSRVLPKDIGYVVVEKVDNAEQWQEKSRTGRFITEGNVKRLEISDKTEIETCLRNYKYSMDESRGKYVIGFYSTDKRELKFGSFDENSAPDFVKAYFK